MIITCPSCGASFNVKAEALGPNGRSVKCSKCAHRWHATADGDATDVAADPPVVEAPPVAEAPPVEQPTEVPEAPPAFADDPPQADEAPAAAEEFQENAGESAAEGAEPVAEEAAPMMPPAGMREALGLADGPADVSDEEPRSRSRRPPASAPPRRRHSMGRVYSIFVLLLAVCGAASAAVFMKNEIMMWLPATERLYAFAGLGPEVLGHGLQIVEPTPKKEVDGNDEILIVEGEIRNVAEKPVEVPLMRGALLDAQGKELHSWTFTAAKSRIAPGEQARYRTEFRNPPSEAQSLDITFTRGGAAPASAAQDGGMMSESSAKQQ